MDEVADSSSVEPTILSLFLFDIVIRSSAPAAYYSYALVASLWLTSSKRKIERMVGSVGSRICVELPRRFDNSARKAELHGGSAATAARSVERRMRDMSSVDILVEIIPVRT